MSKYTKFVKSPKLFFKDMLNKPKPKPKPKPKSKQSISIISSVWNKIVVHSIDLSHYQICLYFSGEAKDIYQVEQWIPVLEKLDNDKKLIIIARNKSAFEWLTVNTKFTIIHCISIQDVLKFYENNNIKVILYVNHAFKNFQSLINGNAYHVHINHGESDKTSTITRQSHAYDYVFVYGNQSINKYKNNLIAFNQTKFVKVGRPQLEYTGTNNITSEEKKIILYAPTWEGTHDTMDFSSVRHLGVMLINILINSSEYHIVYKPHPKVGTRDPFIKSLHKEIINILSNYKDSTVMLDGDIVSIYNSVDIAIFDNSVVLLDYLSYNKPLLVTDIISSSTKELMNNKSLILDSGINLSKDNLFSILSTIEDELKNDTNKLKRNHVRKEFLGDFDYSNGESTTKFIHEINLLCNKRDKALEILNNLEINEEKL